jgi:hypothetical protein
MIANGTQSMQSIQCVARWLGDCDPALDNRHQDILAALRSRSQIDGTPTAALTVARVTTCHVRIPSRRSLLAKRSS